MVAGFIPEWWPTSNRNGGRLRVGKGGRNKSEFATLIPENQNRAVRALKTKTFSGKQTYLLRLRRGASFATGWMFGPHLWGRNSNTGGLYFLAKPIYFIYNR
jgi:hypothetical protein